MILKNMLLGEDYIEHYISITGLSGESRPPKWVPIKIDKQDARHFVTYNKWSHAEGRYLDVSYV